MKGLICLNIVFLGTALQSFNSAACRLLDASASEHLCTHSVTSSITNKNILSSSFWSCPCPGHSGSAPPMHWRQSRISQMKKSSTRKVHDSKLSDQTPLQKILFQTQSEIDFLVNMNDIASELPRKRTKVWVFSRILQKWKQVNLLV